MTFPPAVEQWRSQITRFVSSPQGGVDYWLAWIQRESGGNPCSYTSLRESGLFQLMPPDNTNQGGTTEAALRTACAPGSQTQLRGLTDAEIREQMVSFQKYLDYLIVNARIKLATAGVPWTDAMPAFWQFVKLQHAYPGPSLGWLQQAKSSLGRPPADFAELVSTVSGYASVLTNAAAVGAYGRATAGGSALMLVGLVGGAALLYYLWRSRQ